MDRFVWESPEEINRQLAKRLRTIRRSKGISQEKLAEDSGVSFGSIKRFETSGNISLLSLTKLAIALGCADEITASFSETPYRDIREVIRDTK